MNKEIATLTKAIVRIENKIDLLAGRMNNLDIRVTNLELKVNKLENLECRITNLEETKKNSSSKSFSIQNR